MVCATDAPKQKNASLLKKNICTAFDICFLRFIIKRSLVFKQLALNGGQCFANSRGGAAFSPGSELQTKPFACWSFIFLAKGHPE